MKYEKVKFYPFILLLEMLTRLRRKRKQHSRSYPETNLKNFSRKIDELERKKGSIVETANRKKIRSSLNLVLTKIIVNNIFILINFENGLYKN